MATKTTTIARAVIAITGRGIKVFNDPLVDGRRSLKVWGWQEEDYNLANNLLTSAGCKVTKVKTHKSQWKGRTRLHVAE